MFDFDRIDDSPMVAAVAVPQKPVDNVVVLERNVSFVRRLVENKKVSNDF